ncbi:MAG: type II toxin-antitoxin system RelE/ParE family toxin [Rhizobiaceae bacterium]|nr:type II toxin-antitoxin system RelE/ParE family toxin [Rhizobiaceae bacterium]
MGVSSTDADRPTRRYARDLWRLGASDEEVAALEQAIADDPTAGDVIPGLDGIRKIRFALGSKGKRGGGRTIYFLMVTDDAAVMLFAYAKNEQEDLTKEQRKAALAMLKEMRDG